MKATEKKTKTTVWVKRVVLVNGEAATKGRPNKELKGSRTCVYIQAPKGVGVAKVQYGEHVAATKERPYNPTKNKDQRPQFKRTLLRALVPVAGEAVAVNQPETTEAVLPVAEETVTA